jgi:hypothetical protein
MLTQPNAISPERAQTATKKQSAFGCMPPAPVNAVSALRVSLVLTPDHSHLVRVA